MTANSSYLPSFAKTIAHPARYKGNGAQLTAEIQRLYSIFLWDMDAGEIPNDLSLDIAGQRAKAEFFFNVPPRSIDMTEPFTTSVIATQNGGKFIESHGSIFKDIRIAGTTGLRPKKAAPNTIPLFNTQPFQTLADPFVSGFGSAFTEIRTLPKEEVTGFDDIHFLRNIFRRYSDHKANGRRILMVWRNTKDDDYWIVEPKDFKLSQNSKSPLTYEYQISLQAVSKFTGNAAVASVDDPQAKIRDIQRFLARVQEYQQALKNSFLVISTNINRIKAAGYFATDLLTSPIIDTLRGLAAINNSLTGAAKGVERAAREGSANIQAALVVLQDSMERPFEGLLSTTRPRVSYVRVRDSVIRSLRRTNIVFARILTEKSIRDSIAATANTRLTALAGAYVNPTGGTSRTFAAPSTGGDPGFIGTGGGAATVAEGTVHAGETIRDAALRLMGDGRLWHALVILNDLRAPYVSDDTDRMPGVLGPGDPLFYPSSDGLGISPSSINPVNASGAETDGQGQSGVGDLAAQSYGRDIRLLTSTTESGVELTDIAINHNGDIATIVGVPNVEQAIKIKFSTEVRDLPAHPNFGSRYPIGTKADIASFNTFRLNVLGTLLSDDRVSDVTNLQFQAFGDILVVKADILLTASRDYLSTSFALRRF